MCATGFFVIKTIQPHICLLDFFRTVVKWVGDVLLGGYGYFHFRGQNRVVAALNALGRDFKVSQNLEIFSHHFDILLFHHDIYRIAML